MDTERPPDPSATPSSARLGALGAAVLVAVSVLVGTLVVGGVALVAVVGNGDVPAGDVPAGDVPAGDDAGSAAVGASAEPFAVWDRRDDGTPVRWDPCGPIRIVVSGSDQPAGVSIDELRADVGAAVTDLRDASGLDLRVVGTTDERPSPDRSTTARSDDGDEVWAPVLVGWARPDDGLPLRDTDRAVAVPVAVAADGGRVYVTGQVVLNADRTDLVPGRADRATSWGATIQHELAHIVGLAHVDDPAELLSVHPGDGPVAFGPGDLEGLAAVGDDGTCLDVPAPRELDVRLPER